MRSIETGHGIASYREGASNSTGTPLLFLHGVGSDSSAWAPQLAHFAPARRAFALDLPGYRGSVLLQEPDADDFAGLVLGFLDSLAIPRVHLVGLSLGGVVAIALHHAAPRRIASLTLADSFARHPDGPAILDRSLAGLARAGMRGLAEARVDALLAQPTDPSLRARIVETMAGIDPAAYAAAAHVVWLADQRARLGGIGCPTLIVCGSDDRVTPPNLSEDLKNRIAGAGLVEIAAAGHLPNLEQPATFNRVLAAFLADTEQTP